MNNITEPSPSVAPEESVGEVAVACVILGLSFLVGAPGNLLVIWTILRHVKQRSHTVVLILHLAAADLLVLITLPIWIYSLADTWVFGVALCKILAYVINACMYSSIFFITLMSVERYVAICRPFVMMRWKSNSTMNRCLVLFWLLAFLLGVPALESRTVDERNETKRCHYKDCTSNNQGIINLCLQVLVGFVIPFTVLSVCYSLVAVQLKKMRFNSKQKSMVLIHAVVIAFTVCWLPFHIINIINLVCCLHSDIGHECVPQSVVLGSGALAFISSSVNPVLYAFLSRSFQGNMKDSRLVRLFREVTTQTNKLMDLAAQQETGQGTTITKEELLCDSLCK
ncbi:leukotriene B4 receptor 1-like [Mugil cephalus]|uniref:leukotriene B4 receptor 1-like n=1 Tax=Mugil cephalus TaxID=48193 RepID=UPI001FB7F1E7|nr:leukotriene B4 receptor 1-like [Mugil cephalus]